MHPTNHQHPCHRAHDLLSGDHEVHGGYALGFVASSTVSAFPRQARALNAPCPIRMRTWHEARGAARLAAVEYVVGHPAGDAARHATRDRRADGDARGAQLAALRLPLLEHPAPRRASWVGALPRPALTAHDVRICPADTPLLRRLERPVAVFCPVVRCLRVAVFWRNSGTGHDAPACALRAIEHGARASV